jgi:hypothetical protein
VAPAEFYAREQVNVTVEKPLTTPERCTRLLDLKQQLVSFFYRLKLLVFNLA